MGGRGVSLTGYCDCDCDCDCIGICIGNCILLGCD